MVTSGAMEYGFYDLETKRSSHTERSTLHADFSPQNPAPRAEAVLVLIGRRASGADLVFDQSTPAWEAVTGFLRRQQVGFVFV